MTHKTIEQKPSPMAAGSPTTHKANGTAPGQTAADAETGELTFITDEGECITFPESGLTLAEATALAGEEALGKIWNRSSEDQAWRDI